MKIIFFGTPEYVVPVLDLLHRSFQADKAGSIVAVVTQQPKPSGREQKLTFSPVDDWAHKRNLPVFFDSKSIIDNNTKADLGILASFGQIIPKEVLSYFPKGILNIHPSLLPKFRGASPVQANIICDPEKIGVSIIKLDEELDHGPVITQFKDVLSDDDTSATLRDRLFLRSAQVLVDLLPAYLLRKVKPKEQNHSAASFTRQLLKSDGYIKGSFLEHALKADPINEEWVLDFVKECKLTPDAVLLDRFIRAMQPWPGAWTEMKLTSNNEESEVKRLKILKTHVEWNNEKPEVMGIPYLVIDEVQLEGKNTVAWSQFIEGYPHFEFSK